MREQQEVPPWPRSVRGVLRAVLAAVVGTGLVVALHDRGVLPLGRPFVALQLRRHC